ncbi:hypothetical protein Mapa_017372 [Marchantia paleacea]|nr:hypothetical protein Mapa_017372 [Marchantia paleacea]
MFFTFVQITVQLTGQTLNLILSRDLFPRMFIEPPSIMTNSWEGFREYVNNLGF